MNPHGRANAKDPKSKTPLSLSSSGIAIRLIPLPGRLRLPWRHILTLGARGFMEDDRRPWTTRHRLPAYGARAVPDVDRPIGRSYAIRAAGLLESSAAVVMPIEASTRARAGHRDDELRDDALPLTGADGRGRLPRLATKEPLRVSDPMRARQRPKYQARPALQGRGTLGAWHGSLRYEVAKRSSCAARAARSRFSAICWASHAFCWPMPMPCMGITARSPAKASRGSR